MTKDEDPAKIFSYQDVNMRIPYLQKVTTFKNAVNDVVHPNKLM